MLMELLGTFSSVAGNEMASRVGRRRWILRVMGASIAFSFVIGFSAHFGYAAAAILCLLYNALIYADSAALTTGTVTSAEPGRRGTTLAVHAVLGYGGGFVGPLTMGLMLDALGGETVFNWGLSFAHIGVIMLLGPLAIWLLRPKDTN